MGAISRRSGHHHQTECEAHLKIEAVEDLADQQDGAEDDPQGSRVTGMGGG